MLEPNYYVYICREPSCGRKLSVQPKSYFIVMFQMIYALNELFACWHWPVTKCLVCKLFFSKILFITISKGQEHHPERQSTDRRRSRKCMWLWNRLIMKKVLGRQSGCGMSACLVLNNKHRFLRGGDIYFTAYRPLILLSKTDSVSGAVYKSNQIYKVRSHFFCAFKTPKNQSGAGLTHEIEAAETSSGHHNNLLSW